MASELLQIGNSCMYRSRCSNMAHEFQEYWGYEVWDSWQDSPAWGSKNWTLREVLTRPQAEQSTEDPQTDIAGILPRDIDNIQMA